MEAEVTSAKDSENSETEAQENITIVVEPENPQESDLSEILHPKTTRSQPEETQETVEKSLNSPVSTEGNPSNVEPSAPFNSNNDENIDTNKSDSNEKFPLSISSKLIDTNVNTNDGIVNNLIETPEDVNDKSSTQNLVVSTDECMEIIEDEAESPNNTQQVLKPPSEAVPEPETQTDGDEEASVSETVSNDQENIVDVAEKEKNQTTEKSTTEDKSNNSETVDLEKESEEGTEGAANSSSGGILFNDLIEREPFRFKNEEKITASDENLLEMVSHMAQVLNDKLKKAQEPTPAPALPLPPSQQDQFVHDEREVYVEVCDYEAKNTCFICQRFKISKYNFIFRPTETKDVRRYLCADECLKRLKEVGPTVIAKAYFEKFFITPLVDSSFRFVRKCKQCGKNIKGLSGIYSWEAMDFCKENCLFRFQNHFTKKCSECGSSVAYSQLGKYSVRFGSIIRQFCSSICLETKKRKIKICSYCQKSIMQTRTVDGTKCFCNDLCKSMYGNLQKSNRVPFLLNPSNTSCFVCGIKNVITIEFDYHGSSYYFCTNNCFVLFKFIQDCDAPVKKCHCCSKFTMQQYLEKYALFYDNLLHYFCSSTCQHIYVITHRRVIPCVWCKVKKYNFDMIQRNGFLGTTVYVCSLFCLNQLKVSVDSLNAQRKVCFSCGEADGEYDISLADGSTKTFCSNNCIVKFQTSSSTRPKRLRLKGLPEKPGPLPVITSVRSLASNDEKQSAIKKFIVVQDPTPPAQANVMCMVKPLSSDVGTSIEKDTNDYETQTDIDTGPQVKIIPVPIYVPQPLHMWNVPVPRPVPFPLVIPIPFLVTLTRSSAQEYFKEVKKDTTVKAPSDPFEADLLMMAELIASEKKEEESQEIESDIDNTEDFSPEPPDTSFGDDMLSMALKFATDLQEPAVDLEGALTASTITPSQQPSHNPSELMDSRHLMTPSRGTRGRRRGGRAPGRSSRGRGRGRPLSTESMTSPEPEILQVPVEPVEKPDANMCLKYTLGVNAWKQWVTNKNADLERSSRRLKLFNTELLQLTADELNYSLCLFVNEVRKPNGAEYAPDTIYYLCLGIQQYLYENGRIDNIFCDSFYETFTDCLDEICKKFSNLYNDSYYIVTRVEEEHLWESRQLGAHSPHVLLSTLMFFNTKHFNLTSVEEHMQLSFSHIMKHWKRNPNQTTAVSPKQAGNRNVLLRFYPPQTPGVVSRKRKVYEQQENEQNPLRCPVKLYEFYMSKCPESVKNRNDVFYLLPERSCVPDSPVWYSTMALDTKALSKMLHRVKMVKEINVALLTH